MKNVASHIRRLRVAEGLQENVFRRRQLQGGQHAQHFFTQGVVLARRKSLKQGANGRIGPFVVDGLEGLGHHPVFFAGQPQMLARGKHQVAKEGENRLQREAQHLRRHHSGGAPKDGPPNVPTGDTNVPRRPSKRVVGQTSLAAGSSDKGVTKMSATSVGSLTN